MYRFMKRFPGGLLLYPMLLSALINTFFPDLFHIGGLSEAFFTTKGINYVVAATCFCSGAGLNTKTLLAVLKKQGVLLFVKTVMVIATSMLFLQCFGPAGIFGVSAIAFVAIVCSTNPSLFLALESDLGTPTDLLAFGLVGLFCVPAYPMLVYGIAQAAPIDWTPIISTLIPILFGMVLGNLDEEMAKFLAPGVLVLTPLMGWSFGSGINIINALKAGPQGLAMTVVFYLVCLPAMLFVERKFLKADGVSSVALTSIAGMSVSVPMIMATSNPAMQAFAESAAAQISFGVVLSSLITPLLAKGIAKRQALKKAL